MVDVGWLFLTITSSPLAVCYALVVLVAYGLRSLMGEREEGRGERREGAKDAY